MSDTPDQPGSQNDFWRLLVCPISKQHLLPASTQQAKALAQREEVAVLKQNTGDELSFLVTQNQTWAYPVINEVPWLLASRRLRLQR